MPNLKDIERRINSVTSTKQITRTMEMVAAAKIRQATDRMESALPWSVAINDMLTTTAQYAPVDAEALLKLHESFSRVLIVVVTSDRGLAGGFNSNILRHVEKLIKDKEASGANVEVAACGKKAIGYFAYRGIKPVFEFADLSADPTYEEAAQLSLYAGDGYHHDRLDEVIIVYNHAKNAAEQRLVEQQVLPISMQSYVDLLGLTPQQDDVLDEYRGTKGEDKEDMTVKWDIDFEPDAESVMHYLMETYLRNAFYFALLDSAAGEQGARRNAMKSATDNADEMVETLTRAYNRVRQGAITTEINEIVGGAAALEE